MELPLLDDLGLHGAHTMATLKLAKPTTVLGKSKLVKERLNSKAGLAITETASPIMMKKLASMGIREPPPQKRDGELGKRERGYRRFGSPGEPGTLAARPLPLSSLDIAGPSFRTKPLGTRIEVPRDGSTS